MSDLPTERIQDKGICLLAQERPDLLFNILRDNYLPPPQMVLAIRALEAHPDRKELFANTRHLLIHWSTAVVKETMIVLRIGGTNGGGNSAA